MKTRRENVPYGLAQILKLRAVTYRWKAGADGRSHLGVIAQEIEKVLPEVVTARSKTGMLSVAYDELVPVAIKAIQEQESTIRNQDARIEKLEEPLAALEAGRAPLASSVLGNGSATAATLALLPVGFFFARRRAIRQRKAA